MFVQVHRLYESGHYEDVVQLLMPTLYQPQPKTKVRSYLRRILFHVIFVNKPS